jgi:hypothetical protein
VRRAALNALIVKLAAKGITARIIFDGSKGYGLWIDGKVVRTGREAAAIGRKPKARTG